MTDIADDIERENQVAGGGELARFMGCAVLEAVGENVKTQSSRLSNGQSVVESVDHAATGVYNLTVNILPVENSLPMAFVQAIAGTGTPIFTVSYPSPGIVSVAAFAEGESGLQPANANFTVAIFSVILFDPFGVPVT